jgi:hypothetical protein
MTDSDTDQTDLSTRPLTDDETRRRLPTLALIDDDDIRDETRRVASVAPPYFWMRQGSTAGYHNAHTHGLWKHSLQLSTVLERLTPTYEKRNQLTSIDVDRLHSASVLHDMRKAGVDGEETQSDHDLVMAGIIRESTELDTIIARIISSHMGAWGDGPPPASVAGRCLHVADMVCSDDNVDVGVAEPVPEELTEFVDGVHL